MKKIICLQFIFWNSFSKYLRIFLHNFKLSQIYSYPHSGTSPPKYPLTMENIFFSILLINNVTGVLNLLRHHCYSLIVRERVMFILNDIHKQLQPHQHVFLCRRRKKNQEKSCSNTKVCRNNSYFSGKLLRKCGTLLLSSFEVA